MTTNPPPFFKIGSGGCRFPRYHRILAFAEGVAPGTDEYRKEEDATKGLVGVSEGRESNCSKELY